MSRQFDQLQSRSRPMGADLYSPDLLGYSRGATPPFQMAGSPTGPKIPPLPVVPMSDPYSRWFNHSIAPVRPESDLPAAKPGEKLSVLGQKYKEPPAATFDERFGTYPTGLDRKKIEELFQFIEPQPGYAPEYHERFGDPTKVITQGLPPSLNMPYGARGLDQLRSMRTPEVLAQNFTPAETRRMESAIERGDDNTIARYRRIMQQRGIDPNTIPILQPGMLPPVK